MSKSLGNVVRPLEMKARYGMDAFRYFLLREMAFGQDAEFSEAALVTRLNADLANGLGNLASRVLAMQQRYFEGVVQPLGTRAGRRGAARGVRRRRAASSTRHVAELRLPPRRSRRSGARSTTRTSTSSRRRRSRSRRTRRSRPRVGAILHELCEALRVTAQLVAPFLPETAARLVTLLGLPDASLAALDLPWGTAFPPGHRTRRPEVLFPRVEVAPE